jgi:hypothetical protein
MMAMRARRDEKKLFRNYLPAMDRLFTGDRLPLLILSWH